ncbi:ATP-grasp ribosomal peptide maturase [Isoptericola hypogeus]|uniref:ATP-grasp ribosomal peptide maturase n=1 Tax=Isoptericola hypogeus TaxID=300179 RepID=A0ABN2JXC7_9MICO
MILIVSFHDNEHVGRVRAHLTRPAAVFDVADFPARARIDIRFADGEPDVLRLAPRGQDPIDLADVGAVWFRRVHAMELDPELRDPTSRIFAWSESNETLQGVWHATECFWMNPPAADEAGQRKVRQLQLARAAGLSVPRTLITNDPQAARDFVEARPPGGVIRKAFRNIAEAPRSTAVVDPDDLDRIDQVRFAPVTFQEYVPAELDLRVVVVEDEVFAVAIRSRPEFHADYRMGLGSAELSVHRLPDQVAASLLELHKRLGLAYGASDFRVTPDGEHVFLEVNPGGEYLFAADPTGLPVPQAIAACLDRHDKAHG